MYYRTENNAISGTEFTLEIDPMKPAEDLTQLILTFPSSLAAKNTLFNLKRCLRTVLYSFPPKSSDQEVRKVLCVPGGGAAEMSWAQLWESVDVELKAMQYDVSSGQPNALIVSIAKSLNTLLSRRHPVASIYCHRILFHLSTAYYALPQRLLKNCLDIFEPAEMTSHLQEMSPHTFISEDVSIIVDHILRSRCNKFQKAWSIWKALNSRDDVSGLPQRHFFGILANSDPTST